MNDQRPYGVIPPGASRLKRKERESSHHPAKRPPPPPPPPCAAVPASTRITTMKTTTGSKAIEITSSNKLLAGYMAHEFLTKGTLLGQKFDAARSETASMGKIRPVAEPTSPFNGNESYEQITSLLMMKTDGGDHLSGIVNPTQLRRWIEM